MSPYHTNHIRHGMTLKITYDGQQDGVLEGRPLYEEQCEPPDEVCVTEYEERGGAGPGLNLNILFGFRYFIHPGY